MPVDAPRSDNVAAFAQKLKLQLADTIIGYCRARLMKEMSPNFPPTARDVILLAGMKTAEEMANHAFAAAIRLAKAQGQPPPMIDRLEIVERFRETEKLSLEELARTSIVHAAALEAVVDTFMAEMQQSSSSGQQSPLGSSPLSAEERIGIRNTIVEYLRPFYGT